MRNDDRAREWREDLDDLTERGLRRKLRRVRGPQGPAVVLDGREVINVSSNNYLGLANHPELRAAMSRATGESGVGASASRLIVGNMTEHEALEHELAQHMETEAALLFNSGYQANLGVLQALAGPDDVIFSDALNHASIIDGCRLSRAAVEVFPHGDLAALGRALEARPARRRFIVTDAVFSMDGDRADLGGLAELADRHGAVLVVDEAHAVGTVGPGGRGLSAELGIRPDVVVGTLGKAFGTFGAYVCGRRELVELLLNRARSFVFTTALPPALVAASRASLALLAGREGVALRRKLLRRMGEMKAGLGRLGLLVPGAGESPIFPILVGDEGRTMECCEALLARGVYAQGIRPPTVPRGTSRLRLALMATHTPEQIERVIQALGEVAAEGLLPVPAKES